MNRFTYLLMIVALAIASSGGLGCGGEPDPPDAGPADTLQASFPTQATKALEHEEAFVATEAGFALGAPGARGAWRGWDVELPRNGGGVIRIRGFGGPEVRMREIGLEGEGTLTEDGATYRRAGGESHWRAEAGWVKERINLEAEVVRRDEPVAAWEVEGATVRQRGAVVDLVDEKGVARLHVTVPGAYTRWGWEVGTRLEGREGRVELFVDAAGEAVWVDPEWTATAPMSATRYGHTATLLRNGKVLVAGGWGSNGLSSAELYDPAANTWTPAAPIGTECHWDSATLLENGKVLVIGGVGFNGNLDDPMSCAKLYDPVADVWTAARSMSTARVGSTATLLENHKVLVVGGFGVSGRFYLPMSSVELYDPVADVWTAARSMSTARAGSTATLLKNGKVLVAGGWGSNGYLSSAELYDPVADVWTAAGSMSTIHAEYTATLLGNGKVLVGGGIGDDDNHLWSAELYDPVANVWTAAGSMSTARFGYTATLLKNGKVLVAGGSGAGLNFSLSSAELYDPVADVWTAAGSMSTARVEHTATLLENGKVLMAGGESIGFESGPFLHASTDIYELDPRDLGYPCTSAAGCQSGFCADGVCCNAACNGECGVCSVATGATADGTCSPRAAGIVCRNPAGLCDVAEVCDGAATECPANAVALAGTECRAAEGPCDVADLCDGAGSSCPDAVEPPGTQCRSAAGPCDESETCDGHAKSCPRDIKTSPGTICRPASGPCDRAETCDGAATSCPSDKLAPPGTECRAAAGLCDIAEVCSGTTASCPADIIASAGTACRAATGPCDIAETCNGIATSCPVDVLVPAGIGCRPAAGPCDVAEVCSGTATDCPADAVAPRDTECRAAAGPCDIAETCDGAALDCPADVVASAGSLCRPTAGECDLAEACDGLGTSCPADRVAPDHLACSLGECVGGTCAKSGAQGGNTPPDPSTTGSGQSTGTEDDPSILLHRLLRSQGSPPPEGVAPRSSDPPKPELPAYADLSSDTADLDDPSSPPGGTLATEANGGIQRRHGRDEDPETARASQRDIADSADDVVAPRAHLAAPHQVRRDAVDGVLVLFGFVLCAGSLLLLVGATNHRAQRPCASTQAAKSLPQGAALAPAGALDQEPQADRRIRRRRAPRGSGLVTRARPARRNTMRASPAPNIALDPAILAAMTNRRRHVESVARGFLTASLMMLLGLLIAACDAPGDLVVPRARDAAGAASTSSPG